MSLNMMSLSQNLHKNAYRFLKLMNLKSIKSRRPCSPSMTITLLDQTITHCSPNMTAARRFMSSSERSFTPITPPGVSCRSRRTHFVRTFSFYNVLPAGIEIYQLINSMADGTHRPPEACSIFSWRVD